MPLAFKSGVLDDLYAFRNLGVELSDGTPTLRVWAPTAISVGVWLYDNAMLTTGSSTQWSAMKLQAFS